MVNNMGAKKIRTEAGAQADFGSPKMHKAFSRQEVLINKGERLKKFLFPLHLYWVSRVLLKARELGKTTKREIEIYFCDKNILV